MIQSSTIDRLITWSALIPPLILLAAAYWLNQLVQPLPIPSDTDQRHDPDFMVSQFTATTMNEQGSPRFIIAAKKMLHYPDDDSTHLESPRLTSLSPDHPAMYATANSGTISGKGDEIFLRDEVKVVRAANAAQSELIFTTSYLHVIPDHDRADTDQAVTVTDAYNTIHAIGMRMDYRARTVKLLAHVNSYHEPAKK